MIVCVYGNRGDEDTLLELNNICTDNGFVAISAGAFIAKHSIFPAVAEERPDKNDIQTAKIAAAYNQYGSHPSHSVCLNSIAG